jgi:Ca2+-binding RTX toxin-like protein
MTTRSPARPATTPFTALAETIISTAASGDDYFYGGAGADYISPNDIQFQTLNTNWGYDVAYAGSGDDTLDFARTWSNVELHGESGTDMIFGGFGSDNIYGESDWDYLVGNNGNDFISGGGGGDVIYGGDGYDTLMGDEGADIIQGGAGRDWINGGTGADTLTGGTGSDHFTFYPNQSPVGTSHDVITDWDVTSDWIDVGDAASASTYTERYIGYASGYSAALQEANVQLQHVDYVFISDFKNGYLFADFDGNGTADASIELLGATSLSQLNWSDLV